MSEEDCIKNCEPILIPLDKIFHEVVVDNERILDIQRDPLYLHRHLTIMCSIGGSCKTWMLDGWTILAKNLDNAVKNNAFSGLFFELNGLHSVKPGLEKPGLRNHGCHFGRPLQSMVA